MNTIDKEKNFISPEAAEARAALLLESLTKTDNRSAIKLIASATDEELDKIEVGIKTFEQKKNDPAMAARVKAARDFVEIARKVKANPKLIIEMMDDPTHPLLLQFTDSQLDLAKHEDEEHYELINERASLAAEVAAALGGREKLEQFLTDIGKKALEIQNIRPTTQDFFDLVKGIPYQQTAVLRLMNDTSWLAKWNINPVVMSKMLTIFAIETNLAKMQAKRDPKKNS